VIAHVLLLMQVAGSPAPRVASSQIASSQIADPVPACLRTLQASPRGKRISASTWQAHTRDLTLDKRVLAQLNAQPEFKLPIWDYMAVMVDDERIADGHRMMITHRAMLDTIYQRTQVEPAVLLALWGIESNFGRGLGSYSVLQSLATLSCAGRRQSYFRGEFFAALRIVQAGHVSPSSFSGSWAGAFGHTQFMPGTFEWLAVDYDGDGRKDVLGNIGDALASAANFLRNAKWKADMPWGVEVKLPRVNGTPFSTAREGRRTKRPLSTWNARGVTRMDGSPLITGPLTASTPAALITPSGVDGPAFLVFANFDALYRYNAAESYTLAIAHLADRIAGRPPLIAAWPTNDLGLSRAERRELQTLLAKRGHDIGQPTGYLTSATILAIKAEQERLGRPITGRPGQIILELLRGGS
jgi:lytic murein transglycosylase